MNIREISLTRFNVILVFDTLDMSNVSFDIIKTNFNNQAQIHQLQNNLAIVMLANPRLQVQIERNRLVFICQNNNIRETFDIYPETINKFLEAISDNNMTAFGYNFDGNAILDYNEDISIGKYFMNKFESNWKQINKISNGEVSSFNPNFTIKFDAFAYNININVSAEKNFSFHLNVHYDNPGDLKLSSEFSCDINKHYNKFIDILRQI